MTDFQATRPSKKTIYRPTSFAGIRSIWDWSEKRGDYVQRRDGNKFQASVERNGQSQSQSFGSIEDARRWRERTKFELDQMPSFERMSFRELFEKFIDYKRARLQITTIESYLSLSRHFDGLWGLQVEMISSTVIDAWLKSVASSDYLHRFKGRRSRISYRHEVTLLRTVFAYYKEYVNERFENPVRRRHREDAVINPKEVARRRSLERDKYIPAEEIERLLDVFRLQTEKKPMKRMYFVSALMQLRTGLRIGEICSLRWEEIEWDNCVIRISKTVQWGRYRNRSSSISDQTKTGESRIAYLIPEVIEALRALRKAQGRITGLIFSPDGVKLPRYRCIQHHYDYAFKEANVSFRSTHILRHTFATHFLEATANPVALKGIMGHAEMRMTEKYAKTTDRTAIAGMQAFASSLALRKPENA